MKAAVMHDASNIVLEEVPKPSPEKGELLVRIMATRVCKTDVQMYRGLMPGVFLPRILGHEPAGEVAEVGEGVSGFNIGDRVAIDPLVYCGKCHFCRTGMNNLCENGGLMGREANGSFAEYAIITPERAMKISDRISFDVACFAEAVGSVYRGQCKAQLLRPGASVLILGLGSIGMIQAQFAKLAGANPIIGVSRSQWKLDLALQLGADVVIDANTGGVAEELKRLTPHGGADVVIEAAGAPVTIQQTYHLVRPGGEIIQYGIGPSSVDNINTYLQYYKELTVYGVRAFTYGEFSISTKFLEDQSIRIEPIITHRLPLEKTADGLELSEKQTGEALGIVINS